MKNNRRKIVFLLAVGTTVLSCNLTSKEKQNTEAPGAQTEQASGNENVNNEVQGSYRWLLQKRKAFAENK